MENKQIYTVATIAVVVILGGLLISGNSPISSLTSSTSKEVIGNRIKILYELANPGSIVEITTMEKQNGLYKVVLKVISATDSTYGEAYVTLDGKLLTSNVVNLEQQITQIEILKNFVDCLDSKNVRIFGSVEDQASLLQINVLGAYSPKLFVSCDGEENIQACVDAGISQIPSIVIGSMIEPGVQGIDWFSEVTGCEL